MLSPSFSICIRHKNMGKHERVKGKLVKPKVFFSTQGTRVTRRNFSGNSQRSSITALRSHRTAHHFLEDIASSSRGKSLRLGRTETKFEMRAQTARLAFSRARLDRLLPTLELCVAPQFARTSPFLVASAPPLASPSWAAALKSAAISE